MSIIYIVGGIVSSISSTRGLRASGLGKALFFWLYSLFIFYFSDQNRIVCTWNLLNVFFLLGGGD